MRSFLLAFALCLPLGVAFAQTSGSIIGEVKDESGAVTPNAEVVVTNSETNVMRSTTTNCDSGRVRFKVQYNDTLDFASGSAFIENLDLDGNVIGPTLNPTIELKRLSVDMF